MWPFKKSFKNSVKERLNKHDELFAMLGKVTANSSFFLYRHPFSWENDYDEVTETFRKKGYYLKDKCHNFDIWVKD